jgi:hypothetical protein
MLWSYLARNQPVGGGNGVGLWIVKEKTKQKEALKQYNVD